VGTVIAPIELIDGLIISSLHHGRPLSTPFY